MNSIELFDKYAESYQNSYMNVSAYHEPLDVFINFLNNNDSIIDIACGPGNVSKYILSKNESIKIHGIDGAQRMIELAQINNPSAKFEVMDIENISSIKSNYDGIICSFALPYLKSNQLENLLRDLNLILKTNGILYLSTMVSKENKEVLETSSKGDQTLINYYSVDYLRLILSRYQFVIQDEFAFETVDASGRTNSDKVFICFHKK